MFFRCDHSADKLGGVSFSASSLIICPIADGSPPNAVRTRSGVPNRLLAMR